ncbi:glycoside hydrolase family 25 protein [uncultured Corynebacterium sp.]|uniref:glycoside hydrolase family 25 protein n=1 Tax=uncultured Corynebacterium sp. TaxID=159447 RepID=UPI0025F84CB2|nr:glycoside hydrolase family 25 protein [uncultured Corynebacterium sp.]
MSFRTVTFPASRPTRGTRRNRVGIVAAMAAALPLVFGVVAPAPAEAFTADSPTGIDVSKWQRPAGIELDWDAVAASGEEFAFIKATDGQEGLSPYFAEDSKAAADAGLMIGSYHKAHPDRDAIVQADAYAEALKLQPADARTLPPVLDMELDAGMTPAALEKWAATFLERVELKTGETPMIYTYRWFWVTKMADTNGLNGYPLWLAAYQNEPPTDVPGGWNEPLFWQRSETGVVPGIVTPVDLNTFNGTKAQLEALDKGGAGDGVNGRGAGDATASPETRDESTTPAEAAGARRAAVEDDTEVAADAVSPPTGRAAGATGSLGAATDEDDADDDKAADENKSTDDDDAVIGGEEEDATTPDSPLATSELIDAILEVVEGGSDDADIEAGLDAVRDAAKDSGLQREQIDTLIAFLKQALESGNVPEDQLEEIGDTAPNADETDDVIGGDATSSLPVDVQLMATTSDVVALLASATR